MERIGAAGPEPAVGARSGAAEGPEPAVGDPSRAAEGPQPAGGDLQASAPGRPTPIVRISFVLRGVALWFGIHLGMAFLEVLHFTALQAAFMLAVVYGGVWLDQRARREGLLLGNAGIPPWVGPGHAVAAAALMEGMVQVWMWRAA